MKVAIGLVLSALFAKYTSADFLLLYTITITALDIYKYRIELTDNSS